MRMHAIGLVPFFVSSHLLLGTPGPVAAPRAIPARRPAAVAPSQQSAVGQAARDVDLAAIRNSAEHGDSKAQRILGDSYKMGFGVPQDRAQAFEWYRKAAKSGDAFALGEMYANGEGVTQDYAQALASYRKAADQGDRAAQSAIGSLYLYGGSIFNMGRGMRKDYAQAFVWFQKAAEEGDENGLFGLGALYASGLGVSQDFVEAYKWMSVAVALAPETLRMYLKEALDSVGKVMTSQQIGEAQKRASEWRAAFEKRPHR